MNKSNKMHFPPQVLLQGDCEDQLKAIEGRRILVIGSVRSAALMHWTALFPDRSVAVFAGSLPHSPQAALAECLVAAREFKPDTLIAIGSGSAIDLGKAMLDSTPAELIAIPTSLGGGEMTNTWGVRTSGGTKEGKGGFRYLAKKVIYDARLLATLPKGELAASGINSWAHCIEAFYSLKQHWVGKSAAVQGGRMWPDLLLSSQQQPIASLAEKLFEAASLAGFAINTCGLGLHHAACHVIGGATGLTHGLINAIALPKTLAINREIAPDAIRATEQAMLIDDLVAFSRKLIRQLGLPQSLVEMNVPPHLAGTLAEALMSAHHLQNNPAKLDKDRAERLMHAIFSGDVPD
ncbi:MAG: iron-containing alcohol dehydrogenase [Casimicrobiaceae bacterium]